ncbi:phage portal protein [Listeria monocytogenes]|uniref:phage portal protein n=1 Tax=Listeria monocytogenes TaxID=1639 RepID=UPI003F94714F
MPLFRRTNAPTSRTRQIDLSTIIDSLVDSDTTDWSTISALKNSDVFTAISMIASDIASTDIIERLEDERKSNSNVARLFNQNPCNGEMNSRDFKQLIVANLLLNGESFVYIIRDSQGKANELQFLPNDTINLKWKDNKLNYSTNEGKGLPNKDVLHFRYMSIDGVNVYSPLYALASEIGISQGSKKFLKNFFQRGATPATIVTYNDAYLNNFDDDKQDEAVKALTNRVQKSFAKNAGGVLPLDDTVKIEQLKVPTEVLQFLNSYTFSSQQIAKAFRIPAQLLGNEQANTGLSDLMNQYLTTCLSPIFSIITSELELKQADTPDTQFTFDVERFIDNDPTKRVETTVKLLQAGILEIDEARRRLGLPKKYDAEKLLVSLNYTPLSNLTELQNAKIKNTGASPITELEGGGTE